MDVDAKLAGFGGFCSIQFRAAGCATQFKSLSHSPGTNLVLLSPDVSHRDGAEYFPDEQSVNTALRTLIHVAKGPLRRAVSVSDEQGKNKIKSPALKNRGRGTQNRLGDQVRASRPTTTIVIGNQGLSSCFTRR